MNIFVQGSYGNKTLINECNFAFQGDVYEMIDYGDDDNIPPLASPADSPRSQTKSSKSLQSDNRNLKVSGDISSKENTNKSCLGENNYEEPISELAKALKVRQAKQTANDTCVEVEKNTVVKAKTPKTPPKVALIPHKNKFSGNQSKSLIVSEKPKLPVISEKPKPPVVSEKPKPPVISEKPKPPVVSEKSKPPPTLGTKPKLPVPSKKHENNSDCGQVTESRDRSANLTDKPSENNSTPLTELKNRFEQTKSPVPNINTFQQNRPAGKTQPLKENSTNLKPWQAKEKRNSEINQNSNPNIKPPVNVKPNLASKPNVPKIVSPTATQDSENITGKVNVGMLAMELGQKFQNIGRSPSPKPVSDAQEDQGPKSPKQFLPPPKPNPPARPKSPPNFSAKYKPPPPPKSYAN